MVRRKLAIFGQIVVFILVMFAIYLHLNPIATSGSEQGLGSLDAQSSQEGHDAILSRGDITTYIKAILNPSDTNLPRLECPRPNLSRYEELQIGPSEPNRTPYFFALNLRNCLPVLPQLLGSIVEAIRFLGPENCTLSIVEGNSPDGTAEVLEALQPELTKLGVRTYFVLRNTIDPLADGSDRFSSLAELRNMALAPLRVERQRYTDATVVFVNDVALCLEDILELVYQRRYQGADMACAMDWVSNDPPVFYDVYVARAINGDTFFEIPPGVSWDRATYLFWNEPIAQSRFEKH